MAWNDVDDTDEWDKEEERETGLHAVARGLQDSSAQPCRPKARK